MTETTDIKALLIDMRELAERIVECQGENADGEEIIDLYDLSDTTFKAENILRVLGALEAERQRSENWKISFDNERLRADKLATHIEALRGAQEPVAWIVHARAGDQLTTDGDYVANAEGMGGIHSTPLYRQPTPVVVLNSSAVMSRSYVVKQIEAAGIVVKDGE